MTVSLDHNVGSVIQGVDDVKDDLRHEMRKRVGAAVKMLERSAKMYVRLDANHTGKLRQSIGTDTDFGLGEMSWNVHTDPEIAPYATIVEYGTGDRTSQTWSGATHVPPPGPDEVPPDWPYSSPSIEPGTTKFEAFVGHIADWMRTKPVAPEKETLWASASAIAHTIVTRGTMAHPFMRPAWYQNERRIERAAKHALKNAVR